MSSVAPVGPASEYHSVRQEELDRPEQAKQSTADDKLPTAVKADAQKQAEKTTLNDFQYTGKGSFIDKVF